MITEQLKFFIKKIFFAFCNFVDKNKNIKLETFVVPIFDISGSAASIMTYLWFVAKSKFKHMPSLCVPDWLTDDLHEHFVNCHDKGHDLQPCKLCQHISVKQRIDDVITHTLRVSFRAYHELFNMRVPDYLYDKHQNTSVENAKTYINTNVKNKTQTNVLIGCYAYFVTQLGVAILKSNKTQQDLLIAKLIEYKIDNEYINDIQEFQSFVDFLFLSRN